MPTRYPSAAMASARLTVTVDLPTPPLPDATATICLTPSITGCSLMVHAGRAAAGRPELGPVYPCCGAGAHPGTRNGGPEGPPFTGCSWRVSETPRSEEHTSELQSRP